MAYDNAFEQGKHMTPNDVCVEQRKTADNVDLVERLKAQPGDDHSSGCLGRQYFCDCGYDLTTEGLLEMAADEITRLRSDLAIARKALEEVSQHWAIQYDHPRKENEMYHGSYGIGVTDGHRACKVITDAALSQIAPEEK
jgi:hypothetical protein